MKNKIENWLEESVKVLKNRIENEKEKENSAHLLAELKARELCVEKIKKTSYGPKITKSSISGTYDILGKNSNEAFLGYVGVMSLTHQENQVRATWLIEGKVTHYGYGLIYNNFLCLNFCYEAGDVERYGVVMYEFLTEDCISGEWTEEIHDSIGSEFGRKISSDNIDPLDFFGMN
jgi:hypothetical protein